MEKTVTSNKIDEKNNSKKLSILITRDGLYFCISKGQNLLKFHERRFSKVPNPEEILKNIQATFSYSLEENFKSEISELKVIYANSLFALVPTPYFKKSKLSDYLKFNIRLLETDEIVYDYIKEIDANLVYIPYTNINNYLLDQFGEFSFHHALSQFIKQTYKSESTGTKVFLNLFKSSFLLVVYKNGKLLLANTFDYYTPEDLAYYVLFTLEQLNLDKESLKMKISGFTDEDSEAYKLLYTYIRNISFNRKRDSELKIEDAYLKNTPIHFHQFFINTL